MRTTLEPRLIDPTSNEPGVIVDVRDERRALLFDLGELDQLSPRLLLRVTHAFVKLTHMDHFSGLDHLLAGQLQCRLTAPRRPRDNAFNDVRSYAYDFSAPIQMPILMDCKMLRRKWAVIPAAPLQLYERFPGFANLQ